MNKSSKTITISKKDAKGLKEIFDKAKSFVKEHKFISRAGDAITKALKYGGPVSRAASEIAGDLTEKARKAGYGVKKTSGTYKGKGKMSKGGIPGYK